MRKRVDVKGVERIAYSLLEAIGEDPKRDGLRDTPRRFAAWWSEFIDFDPGDVTKTFEVERVDEMVVVTGIEVWSLCEHHLLPFTARIAIGYLPNREARAVLGLSKFGRIAFEAAHRLQIQERLVLYIADRITAATGSADVGVVADGEHLCMTMRGVRAPATLRTSVMRGAFRETPQTRAEFLSIAGAR